MSAYRLQDPDEKLAYSVDWTPWLATGDSITSASWVITPLGPTVVDLGESASVVSASVVGMTRGETYRLTCDMVSTDGETGQQSITVRCDHK